MDIGHFYFLDDTYFVDFPDPNLCRNKEIINGQLHGRPCFYSFVDPSTNLNWMIPISSQLNKYYKIYNQKKQKYGKCLTIAFGDVLGCFLIFKLGPL